MKIFYSLLLCIIIIFGCFSQKKTIEPDSGVILLTFEGFKSEKNLYANGHLFHQSGFRKEEKEEIRYQVRKYFSLWSIEVTLDDSIFYNYPIDHRVRCVITSDTVYHYHIEDMYLYRERIGGISKMNCIHIDSAICLISSSYVYYDLKCTAVTIAHETGHALGLDHQAYWLFNQKVDNYNPGGPYFAPIMGNACNSSYPVWWIGFDEEGKIQNDTSIISKTFKRIQ